MIGISKIFVSINVEQRTRIPYVFYEHNTGAYGSIRRTS